MFSGRMNDLLLPLEYKQTFELIYDFLELITTMIILEREGINITIVINIDIIILLFLHKMELDEELCLMIHPVFYPQTSSCCGQFFDAYDNLVPYTSAAGTIFSR